MPLNLTQQLNLLRLLVSYDEQHKDDPSSSLSENPVLRGSVT